MGEKIKMPLYEYKCSTCNQQFETIQSTNDAPLKVKEGCKKKCNLQKLLSTYSMSFIGSGFYQNDYKNK